jgi:hypothetical protein
VDLMIILKYVLEKVGCEVVGWIHAAPDRDQWQTIVNIAMNLRVL